LFTPYESHLSTGFAYAARFGKVGLRSNFRSKNNDLHTNVSRPPVRVAEIRADLVTIFVERRGRVGVRDSPVARRD